MLTAILLLAALADPIKARLTANMKKPESINFDTI